jgi:ABC-type uncharacterized transport system ATPase subunit
LRTVPGVAAVDAAHGTLRVTVQDGEAAPRQLLSALAAQEVTVVAFERQRPTLEDVFLSVVGRDRPGVAA